MLNEFYNAKRVLITVDIESLGIKESSLISYGVTTVHDSEGDHFVAAFEVDPSEYNRKDITPDNFIVLE